MKIHGQLAGRFKLQVRKADSLELVRETPWFDNLILDTGLNRFGTGEIAPYCQVGTNATVPNTGQTELIGFVAGAALVTANTTNARATVPYYGNAVRTYRFLAGEAAGTLAEVGVGWSLDTDLWCRALILDADNNPTTITVLADEVLDVSYELRIYPDLVDKIFVANIDGEDRDCILRAAAVTDASAWGAILLGGWGITTGWAYPGIYNGTIGAITSTPSGSAAQDTGPAVADYVDFSYERAYSYGFGLDDGNLIDGISALLFMSSVGAYQMFIDPPVEKDNTQTLTLQVKFIWSRYVP